METSQQEYPVEFDINKERGPIDVLIGSWKDEKEKIQTRREVRENKKNVDEERQKKTILMDETIVPDRTVNTNIKRGRVPYINYITQSKRLLIITDVDEPDTYTEPVELWFTRGMRYPDWKLPWIRQVDCTFTHGGCAMEVMYDTNKPFNVAVEYIARGSLIFHKDTKDLQANPRLLRLYQVSSLQLEEFQQQFCLSEVIVKKLLERFKDNTKLIDIYRILFKRAGVVYNAWYSQEENNEWLRLPQLHTIGLFNFNKDAVKQLIATGQWELMREQMAQILPLKRYPITWFPYDITENEVLLETQGRTALDLHVQEALTQLLTNTVNATTKASRFYPCAENEPGQDPKLEELGPLTPGVVMNRKITFNQLPWPNNIILSITQVLDQRKAQETGNTDFAAIARKDANKTATEMSLAMDQAQQLNVTDLDVFSSPFLDVYGLCFEVARHQAIFGLCKPPKAPYDILLLGDYNLSPAGDVEVVKRAEDKQNAKDFFNIVKGTPLAEKIFAFLLQHYFPDEADAWLQVLNTPDKDAIIQQLVNALQQVPTDELSPEQRTALQAIIISASNVVNGGDNATVSQGAPQTTTGTASTSNATQQAVPTGPNPRET